MIVWAAWFGALFVVFLVLELLAAFGLAPWPTLSRTVWRSEQRYPIIAFLTGAAVGGLAVHLFGWNPACNP